MNQKEVREIKKRFNPEKDSISRMLRLLCQCGARNRNDARSIRGADGAGRSRTVF